MKIKINELIASQITFLEDLLIILIKKIIFQKCSVQKIDKRAIFHTDHKQSFVAMLTNLFKKFFKIIFEECRRKTSQAEILENNFFLIKSIKSDLNFHKMLSSRA